MFRRIFVGMSKNLLPITILMFTLVIMISVSSLLIGDYFLVQLSCKFLMVYYLGLILPYTLHEYFHAKLLEYFKVDIKIEYTVFRFSIIALTEMSGISEILVALVGPVGVFMIGLLLWISNITFYGINLNFLTYFYLFHLIFLLPVFGDGKIVLINVLKYFRRISNGNNN